MAKQVCIDDPMCGPTLDIVDRLCGSEVVSCSTVTVTKCQAALKTLQTFPFFNPTCLCREPQLDQKCNSFRTFLFDHPCLFAQRREKDPYPIDSLVSCSHAHSICKTDANCSKIYDHFKHVCRTNDEDKCIPELQESCKESWSKMRLTPMFGCICPPNLWHGQKKCDRHFNFVNHNRCAGSDLPIETNDVLMNFQSTCFEAMQMCQRNAKCASSITHVITHCNPKRCRRQKCMHSLQAFYRNKTLIKYAVEVAFCLCKKTNNSDEDACMKAQDTLHPSCSQEVDTITPPTCHSVAESCRSDPNCAPLLEEFEQSCATDNYTKTCAGYPEQCRIGMLGILGTKLRTNCICKGTDRAKLYECIGWQRVLWFNPCVVEAQREFHMNKVRARLSRKHNITSIYDDVLTTLPDVIETRTITTAYHTTSSTAMITSPTTTTTTRTPPTIAATTPSTTTMASTTTTMPTTITTQTTTTKATTTTTTTTTPRPTAAVVIRSTEPNTKIFRASYNGLSHIFSSNRSREKSSYATTHSPSVFFTALTKGNHKIIFEEVTEGTTTKKPVFISNAKSRSPKPTVPLPGCVMQKTSLDDGIFIAEGKTIRLYHDQDVECSELCYCAGGNLHCQTACIEVKTCKSDMAPYNHMFPAFDGYKGKCVCYSETFVCARPLKGTYTLPPGVFLFLGYSGIDEQYVKRLVNFEFQECVAGLQEILNKKMAPELTCELELFLVAEESIVVMGKYKNTSTSEVRPNSVNPNYDDIAKDQSACEAVMTNLKKDVVEQSYDIKANLFTSIFKVAEIQTFLPESSKTSVNRHIISTTLLVPIFVIILNLE
ncbi:uncharacterized protein Gfrl isoform X2 [Planococcus citri]